MPLNSNNGKPIGTDPNLGVNEETTETPSYSVSNSLADRLGTGSASTGQNVLYRR